MDQGLLVFANNISIIFYYEEHRATISSNTVALADSYPLVIHCV